MVSRMRECSEFDGQGIAKANRDTRAYCNILGSLATNILSSAVKLENHTSFRDTMGGIATALNEGQSDHHIKGKDGKEDAKTAFCQLRK